MRLIEATVFLDKSQGIHQTSHSASRQKAEFEKK
jgi:hypothetical protein